MAQTAAYIINKAAILLFDQNNIRWSRAELLGWVNEAQQAIATLLPDAATKVVPTLMVQGVRQPLPADCYTLLEIPRNLGTNGTTPGRSPKREERSHLEETNPNWSFDAPATAATMYMYNLRDRYVYYVYPPSDGTGYVELVYSAIPVPLAEGDNIIFPDLYLPAMIDYVMWRAKSKTGALGDPGAADMYLKTFQMYMTAAEGDQAKLAAEMGRPFAPSMQTQGSG